MTHQSPDTYLPAEADPGRQVAQLHQVLELVEQIAGRTAGRPASDAALEQSARISSAYIHAMPIVQRRFDALAAETSAWAAAGVSALLAAQDDDYPPRAAAGVLADALHRALRDFTKVVG